LKPGASKEDEKIKRREAAMLAKLKAQENEDEDSEDDDDDDDGDVGDAPSLLFAAAAAKSLSTNDGNAKDSGAGGAHDGDEGEEDEEAAPERERVTSYAAVASYGGDDDFEDDEFEDDDDEEDEDNDDDDDDDDGSADLDNASGIRVQKPPVNSEVAAAMAAMAEENHAVGSGSRPGTANSGRIGSRGGSERAVDRSAEHVERSVLRSR
jgi:hypothetical protein